MIAKDFGGFLEPGCMSGCSCYIEPPDCCVNCGHKLGWHKEEGCSWHYLSGKGGPCSCKQFEGP